MVDDKPTQMNTPVDNNFDQFKIKGKKGNLNFWKWLLKLSQKKIKSIEDKTVNIISVKFPSPFSILIRYEFINTGEKFELFLQGEYQKYYKHWKESGLLSSEIEIESIIKYRHAQSKIIKTK